MNGYDVLKYGATGIAAPDMNFYSRLRAEKTTAGLPIATITGVPPLSFRADGRPLISWSMLGNGQQTGNPTPDNPIMPTFCGKLVDTDWTIPITCGGQTQAAYLGQVQTVRKIRKLVLTGQETSWYASSGFMYNDTIQPDYLRSAAITIICSHYKAIGGVGAGSEVSNGRCALYRYASVQRFYIRDDNYTSVDDFKAYLAAQYATGTPVTVWYVLAEPETAIINEPLAKIGDYTDELHSEDAGIVIPTLLGSNVFTVETDLQPSSVSITGHIKAIT